MATKAGSRAVPFRHPLPIGMFHLSPDPPPAGDAPADGDTPPAAPPATEPAARTFTQAEVNAFVAKERREALGSAEVAELRRKAGEFDKLEEANRTEQQRLEARAADAEKARDEAIERANKRLVEAAVLAEASAQRAIHPEHLHRLIDANSVTVGEDGQVTGAKEAVEGFLKANPAYVGGRAKGSADQGARGGGADQLTREQLQTMSHEEIDKAHEEGRLDHLLGTA